MPAAFENMNVSDIPPLVLPEGVGAAPTVRLREVFRSLPGKRLSGRASWGEETVFVKVFTDRLHAKRHWRREERGLRALSEKGIPTPPVLFSGPVEPTGNYAVLTKFIPFSGNARELWESLPDDDRKLKLLGSLAIAVANHHQAGILQKDLHLGNFLVSGNEIYSLDGAYITVSKSRIGRRKSLQNLSCLFAQLFPEYDRMIPGIYPLYAAQRGWNVRRADLGALRVFVKRKRDGRKREYLKKIFRECSAFSCQWRSGRRVILNRKYDSAAMRKFLSEPDRYVRDARVFLKRGNTSTVARVKVGTNELVVKRYNIKSVRHAFSRAFRKTRAQRSWENANMLLFYGIRTAEPVALVEKRTGPLRRESYFVAEYVEGVTCSDYFLSGEHDEVRKSAAAEQVASLLKQMAAMKISHGDLKATNIVMSERGPTLLDLDAMREHGTGFMFRSGLSRDLKRFLRNWEGSPLERLFEKQMKGMPGTP